MKSIIRLYKNAFTGLSEPTWILSAVMLINRTGAMVIPFLSIYLVKDLGFDEGDAKWVMTAYGLGAISGTFLGGILTDKLGSYHVQLWSLLVTGVYFVFLSELHTFWSITLGVFFLSVIADVLRPANGASIGHYARKENLTKAFSLNRLAINLGYSIGPLVGGMLIAYGYHILFYVDGVTCVIAGLLFGWYFKSRRRSEEKEIEESKKITGKPMSILKDRPMLLFLISNVLFGTVFFQLLFTLPLYYTLEDGYGLSESTAGALIGFNGVLIFILEMVIVDQWGHKRSVGFFTVLGVLLAGISFLMLNFYTSIAWLVISMATLSMAEIFAIPFAVTLVSQNSPAQSRGKYMSYYSMSFAAARVLAPLLGLAVVDVYGFETLWWYSGVVALLSATGFFYSTSIIEQRSKNPVARLKGLVKKSKALQGA